MEKTILAFAENLVPRNLLVEMPIQIQTPHALVPVARIRERAITAASKRRRYGHARSGKMVQSALYIASKLNILPVPLDSLVQEFGIGGGSGGGSFGLRKGLGGGGGSGGWGRKRRKLELLGVLVVSGCLGLWFVSGERLDQGVLFGSFGLGLFGLSIAGWRRGMKDWVLGFCCCAFLISLVLKKEDLHKLVDSISIIVGSPNCSKRFFGRRRK